MGLARPRAANRGDDGGVTVLRLLLIPLLSVVLSGLLYWSASSPSRVILLLPLLLNFEYRVRFSSFSFDLSETCLLLAAFVYFARRWTAERSLLRSKTASEGWVILSLTVLAVPAIFLESNVTHAASVYRDFLLPFFFFWFFVRTGLEREHLSALRKLAVAFAFANACLGIVQYFTGNYLWFAGPLETEWQAYKTGLAKLSIFGDWLGVQDTLPVGLYNGANMFACFLTVPLCLATALGFSSYLSRWKRFGCLAASAAMFLCLLFTMFRSGLLVYAASLMLIYLYLGRHRPVLRIVTVSMFAAIVAALFLTQGLFDWDQFGSFEGRQDMISEAFALMRAHPDLLLTGGYSDLYHAQSHETQEIHNLALYSVVQFGLPATALFFAFFIRWIRRTMRAARAARGLDRTILVSIIASVAANVFLYGSTTMLIDSVQTSIWLMFWVGVAQCLAACVAAEVEQASAGHLPGLLPARGEAA